MRIESMEPIEGEGSSGSATDFTEIVSNVGPLDNSIIFLLIHDVVAFVLYMHQQIPTVLSDITLEFHSLRDEYKDLEKDIAESNGIMASLRRKQMGRMREVKHGIKRLNKLMNTINSFENALKLLIMEIPSLDVVIVVLGASPIRPYVVYELCFSHNQKIGVSSLDPDFTKTKAAQALSRKVIRALISKDAGSGSYPGPTKLFLLVKAPSSLNLPVHFLPKRDFKYSKKIEPLRLRLKCRSQHPETDAIDCTSQTCSSKNLGQPTSDDFIWFQCRHVVKGLAFKTPTEE